MTCTATMIIAARKDAEYWMLQAGNFRQERDEARAEIERLRRQPSNEVIEAAVKAMAHVNENATGMKFSNLLRRMAVAAIVVYRSSNEQSVSKEG